MSFVAFSPLNQGLLLGKYTAANPPQFDLGRPSARRREVLRRIAREARTKIARLKSRFGSNPADLSRMALQYVLHEPVVACVIPGFRDARQVEMNLTAAGRPLTDGDVEYVREALA